MRSKIAVIAIGVAATAGCVERDGPKVSSPTSAKTYIAEDRADRRPDFLVGTWQWTWSSTGERHCLVLQRDGRAVRSADSDTLSGTWHVRDDGILAISFTSKNYRIDNNAELVDVEAIPSDRDSRWKKVGEIQYSEGYVEGRPDRCPVFLVGSWSWAPSHQLEFHRLVLHRDGRAVRHRDGNWISGTWHVRDDDILTILLTSEFRIDGDSELMDLETIPTDRDFPWRKVGEIQDSDEY